MLNVIVVGLLCIFLLLALSSCIVICSLVYCKSYIDLKKTINEANSSPGPFVILGWRLPPSQFDKALGTRLAMKIRKASAIANKN